MSTRILGFDFGVKSIGVATGNSLTSTTTALLTIQCRDNVPDWKVIEKLIAEWKPRCLVVGLPLSMAGEETSMSAQCRSFALSLEKRFNMPAHLVDERLSSQEADYQLRQSTIGSQNAGLSNRSGRTRSLRSNRVARRNSIAAELILQTYLNDNPSSL